MNDFIFAAGESFNNFYIVLGVIGFVVFLLVAFFLLNFVGLWVQSFLTGAGIGFVDMLRMKLCGLDYTTIVKQKIALVQAGVKDVTPQDMEAHALSRGNLQKVVGAVIAAHKAKMDLKWSAGAAIDLAGRDVYEAVKRSVDPKVIDCPIHPKASKLLMVFAGMAYSCVPGPV